MYWQLRGKGHKVLLAHYADLLKYICKQFFGWNGKKDEDGRTLLQHVGTDVIRKQMPSYWVDFISDILRFFPDEWDYVIIPDTRFPNEIDRLRINGFPVTHIRVIRPNFETQLTEEQQNHPSETALDHIEPDTWIVNDKTVYDLYGKIKQVIKEYANE